MAAALAVILAKRSLRGKLIASFYPDICGHSKRKVAPKDMAWLLAGDDAEAGQTAGLCRARQGYRAPSSQHRPAQTLHSVGKSGIRSRSEHHQLSNHGTLRVQFLRVEDNILQSAGRRQPNLK